MLKSDLENKIYEVVKYKTSIRGYWRDNNGKLYKDYISLYTPKNPLDFDNKCRDLFFKKEKAVFVRGKEKAFVIYPEKQEILENNTIILKDKGKLSPSFFKKLLSDYNGFTIFDAGEYYLIDIWQ